MADANSPAFFEDPKYTPFCMAHDINTMIQTAILALENETSGLYGESDERSHMVATMLRVAQRLSQELLDNMPTP